MSARLIRALYLSDAITLHLPSFPLSGCNWVNMPNWPQDTSCWYNEQHSESLQTPFSLCSWLVSIFRIILKGLKGFDRTDITENIRSIVTFPSHHMGIFILQNKVNVLLLEGLVWRELKCIGTATYNTFPKSSLYTVQLVIIGHFSDVSVVYLSSTLTVRKCHTISLELNKSFCEFHVLMSW